MSNPTGEGIVSWPVVIQRIAIGVGATVAVGGGSMLLANNTKISLHEQRLSQIEQAMFKLPEIDQNVEKLNGKIDVLNQKLDDAQAARQMVATERAKSAK